MKKTVVFLSELTLAAWVAAGGVASATMEMQKKAREAGFKESTNCLYCHGEKLPKKGAKEIDFTWLKEFTPAKK